MHVRLFIVLGSLIGIPLLILPLPGTIVQTASEEQRVTDAAKQTGHRSPVPTAIVETVVQDQDITLVGQIGGEIGAVAVRGDYAYVGVGPRLVVVDVSDGTQPLVVGQTPPLPGIVEKTVISDTYAYAAAGTAGLGIIDISNPSRPIAISFYDTPSSFSGDRWGLSHLFADRAA